MYNRVKEKIYVFDVSEQINTNNVLPANGFIKSSIQFHTSGIITAISGFDWLENGGDDEVFSKTYLKLYFDGRQNIVCDECVSRALTQSETGYSYHRFNFKEPIQVYKNQMLHLELENRADEYVSLASYQVHFKPTDDIVYTNVPNTQVYFANWYNVESQSSDFADVSFNRPGFIWGLNGAYFINYKKNADVSQYDVLLQIRWPGLHYLNTQPTIWTALLHLGGSNQLWFRKPIKVHAGDTVRAQLWNNDATDTIGASLGFHFVPTDLNPAYAEGSLWPR